MALECARNPTESPVGSYLQILNLITEELPFTSSTYRL
jgi:hypothetical protein